ncbi:MAG: hypothetical protein HUU54_16590 [Ignavibacteriaceae bacterium]|nr:hypothetical protein [Ignavibacteriaceae bacterium]
MKIRLLLVLSLMFLIGCGKNDEPAITGPDNAGIYCADFDTLWKKYDRYYVFFDHKKVEWNSAYYKYSGQIAKVNNYNDFISSVRNMLTELKDVHVWLKSKNGEFVQPFFPAYTVNWNKVLWQSYMSKYSWRQPSASWGWFIKDSIGYIAVLTWNKDGILLQQFDSTLDSLRNCKGIIFDIRMNGGGYGPLAGSIGGRFVPEKFQCGFYQIRSGDKHDDLTPMAPIEYPKRGDWQFTKPVILLMGRGCYSTSEIFAAGMTKLPNCISIGDTTGGGLSNSRQFTLKDGTIYSISDQLIYDTDKNIVESQGIPPQVIVEWNLNEVNAGKDPVLDYALNLLRSK